MLDKAGIDVILKHCVQRGITASIEQVHLPSSYRLMVAHPFPDIFMLILQQKAAHKSSTLAARYVSERNSQRTHSNARLTGLRHFKIMTLLKHSDQRKTHQPETGSCRMQQDQLAVRLTSTKTAVHDDYAAHLP